MKYIWFFAGLFVIGLHLFNNPGQDYLIPIMILYGSMVIASAITDKEKSKNDKR